MTRMRVLVTVLPLLAVPALLAAQQVDVQTRLAARGLPPALAGQVGAIAASAATHGVPGGPLADKAIEGWAKHVPAERIVAAVQSFANRMAVAADAIRSGGLESPPGQVVSAAAEAMGGGLGAADVRSIVKAAPTPTEAAPGLNVVAALTAQGLSNRQAVAIVVGAMQGHRPVSELLNLPSVARALHDEGMSPGEIGQHILNGDGGGDDGRGAGSHGGFGDHPPNLPSTGGDGGGGRDRQSGNLQIGRGLVPGS